MVDITDPPLPPVRSPKWDLPNLPTLQLQLPPELLNWLEKFQPNPGKATENCLKQVMIELGENRRGLHFLGEWLRNLATLVKEHHEWSGPLDQMRANVDDFKKKLGHYMRKIAILKPFWPACPKISTILLKKLKLTLFSGIYTENMTIWSKKWKKIAQFPQNSKMMP